MVKIEVYQEWRETSDNKTGWEGFGWQRKDNDDFVDESIEIIVTNTNKFYNPIEGYYLHTKN